MKSDRKSPPFVSAVVLAAGESKRFGDRSKLLGEFRGGPLVRRAVLACLRSKAAETLVVVGHRAGEIREAISDLEVTVVENRRYRKGQSESVKRGLRSLSEEAEAAFFLPADQPFADAQLLDRLIRTYDTGAIVVPACQGRRGAPVLFDRSFFPELLQIQGDEGGRQILHRHPDSVIEVEVEDPRALEDIDTLEDYRNLTHR